MALQGCMFFTQRVDTSPVEIRNARVLSVDKPSYASGIVHTLTVIKMATPSHGDLDVHVTYFGLGQALPKPGALCDMTVAGGTFDGNPARPATSPAVLASAMTCDGEPIRTR